MDGGHNDEEEPTKETEEQPVKQEEDRGCCVRKQVEKSAPRRRGQ